MLKTLTTEQETAEKLNSLEILKLFASDSIGKALAHHEEFDETVWGKDKPSFHNKWHILADIKAAKIYVESVLNDFKKNPEQVNDPLGILRSLDAWNSDPDNTDAQISKKELPDLIRLAFAGHDLGYIRKDDDSGFREKYESKDTLFGNISYTYWQNKHYLL